MPSSPANALPPRAGPRRALAPADGALQLAVFDQAPFAMLVSDARGVVQAMNPAAERLLQRPAAALVGQATLASLHDRDDLAALTRLLRRHRGGHRTRDPAAAAGPPGEAAACAATAEPADAQPMHWRRVDGSPVPVNVAISPLRAPDGAVSGFLCIAHAPAEPRDGAARLERMAYHDALTGLPNRSLLTQRLDDAVAQARARSRALALLFIDLDDFKPVNDNHGHAVGDQVLREVAQRLQSALRSQDLVARIGGDEFVVLLRDLGRREDAASVAGRLLGLLAEPMAVGPLRLQVRASAGLACWPEDGTDGPALLEAADAAMYRAKHAAHRLLPPHGLPAGG